LRTQMSVIQMLKPGVTWTAVQNQTTLLITRELVANSFATGTESDLLANKISSYFLPHGVGHFVGLDVHDTGTYPKILQPGMVITIEPGIYFNEASLDIALQNPNITRFLNVDLINEFNNFGGVRIEDVVLITDTSYEVLSNAPKLMSDISMIMQLK